MASNATTPITPPTTVATNKPVDSPDDARVAGELAEVGGGDAEGLGALVESGIGSKGAIAAEPGVEPDVENTEIESKSKKGAAEDDEAPDNESVC